MAKGSCCCSPVTPTPPWYTIRGCAPATFFFDWKSTNDGLPLDEPPLFANEYETMVLSATSVVTAGTVNADYSSEGGEPIITSRDATGAILLQSDPAELDPYSDVLNGAKYVEVGDNTVWLIRPVPTVSGINTSYRTATVAAFDKVTFALISQFTTTPASNNRQFSSFRAIDDDIVFTYLQTATLTQTVAQKYDNTGALIDSLTVGDLMDTGDIPRQEKPYVSRHTRSYDKILFQMSLANAPSAIRWTEVDLSTLGVNHGPYLDRTLYSQSWPGDHWNIEHFIPAGDKAFMAVGTVSVPGFFTGHLATRPAKVALLDLASLEYDYLVAGGVVAGGGPAYGNVGGLSAMNPCRVTDTHAITTTIGVLNGGVVCYDIATGAMLWRKSSSPAKGAHGLGDIIDLGFIARAENQGSLEIYDIATGAMQYASVDYFPDGHLGAFYVRQHNGSVFASNSRKTDRQIP